MFTVVLIGLVVAFVIAAAIVVTAFLGVAFAEERERVKQVDDELAWRPSFLRGEALRNWAAGTAERITQRRLKGERTALTPTQLVSEVGKGADHAMLPLARQAELERIVACPETGQGTIGVTAVEVLAVVAELRRTRSRSERQNIHDLAQENARALAAWKCNDARKTILPCPLQGAHHVCCAYAARPLHCRPLLALSVARNMDPRRVQFAEATCGPAAANGHEQTVAEGIETGFVRALKSSGFDGNVYELNSALAKALEIPDAAERWARGENVFAMCPRVPAFPEAGQTG